MTVADEVGATCTDFISYTVGTPPEVHIDSPVNGDTATEGQMLDFIATVSDAQDQPDAVLLEWTLNGNPYSTQGATSTGTAQFADDTLSYGSYTLVVTATDTDGLTDADQIGFTVTVCRVRRLSMGPARAQPTMPYGLYSQSLSGPKGPPSLTVMSG